MNRLSSHLTFILATFLSTVSVSQDELGTRASWNIPTLDAIQTQLNDWLTTQPLEEVDRLKIDAIWEEKTQVQRPDEYLDQLILTFAVIDDTAAHFLKMCSKAQRAYKDLDLQLLDQAPKEPYVRLNLRLFVGRWLGRNELYDEAIEILEGIEPNEVVDPASLLFYQAAGNHSLLNKDKCLETIARLRENETTIPRRYATLAKLIEADLAPLKTDSLDEISRLMQDITRRLGLQRAGTRVRKEEDEVLAKLDKMIEELEKQQQEAAAAAANANGSKQSNNPAQDSQNLGGRGAGDVDQRDVGDGIGWGDLPPKQRQEALQRLAKELPAHYREVVEEYFRQVSRDGD
ncbi:MAG: hypothetical protein MK165_10050 [Pirellulaceae bacterium]|nr:hypothetical protein [Pirellulaceae bacterium]